jgi:hypothetical protein
VRGQKRRCLTIPVSTTNTMPLIVTDVSAMFVARITCHQRQEEGTAEGAMGKGQGRDNGLGLACLPCARRCGREHAQLLLRRQRAVEGTDLEGGQAGGHAGIRGKGHEMR